MAGYSGMPQARKLGLKPGQRIGLDHPPAGWQLTSPPPELEEAAADEPADLIIAFFTAAAFPVWSGGSTRAAPCGLPGPAAPQATTATSPAT
jgi:hypothetical protein